MITPAEIKKRAVNKYYAYLQSLDGGESFFPLVIQGDKKPNSDTSIFEKELTDLIAQSKDKIGYGYTIEYQRVKTRGCDNLATQTAKSCLHGDMRRGHLANKSPMVTSLLTILRPMLFATPNVVTKVQTSDFVVFVFSWNMLILSLSVFS